MEAIVAEINPQQTRVQFKPSDFKTKIYLESMGITQPSNKLLEKSK
jgi:hypothetical protein